MSKHKRLDSRPEQYRVASNVNVGLSEKSGLFDAGRDGSWEESKRRNIFQGSKNVKGHNESCFATANDLKQLQENYS